MILKKTWNAILNFFKKNSEIKAIQGEPLLKASRKEITGELKIIEGKLPANIFGVFHVSLPVGTVNSEGLPFPEKTEEGKNNPEFGSPIMNGDGMVIQVNLNQSSPEVKTKLMKTPCFYADEATKQGTKHHGLMGFHNMGITRMSMVFGSRNELNTATQPVKFNGQKQGSLMATYDVGRPYLLDPKSLEIITPMGKSTEWMTAEPPMVPWPFGIAQTSAHPVFDPLTKEVYTVNYSRDKGSFTHMEQTIHHLRHNKESFKDKLEALAHKLVDHPDHDHVNEEVKGFFTNLNHHVDGKPHDHDEPKGDVFMFLLAWDGNGPMKRWELEDQTGDKLAIYECMHQLGITEDFIILTDCSFKFAMDLLFDNPFPESKVIERLIRRLSTVKMEAFTTVYLVKRKDMDPSKEKLTAYRLKEPIPLETIHYSCDYANPDGVITLYGVHNAATCIAEWVRTFDKRALDNKPVDPNYYSLFAVGSMDISRLGKWRIDSNSLEVLEEKSKVLEEPGKWKEDVIGPNTWTIVLYTYRDILSADKVVPTIKQFWYVSDGTDSNLLTKFVYNLYKDYPHRDLSLDDIKEATKRELPFSITRVNLETMETEDYYQCAKKTYIRGVHFIPRKTPDPSIPEELDGYLFCPVQVGTEIPEGGWTYSSEFWVFDATSISKGPICKMKNEEVKFGFTLHTSWMPEADTTDQSYKIPVREDYGEVIEGIKIKADTKFLEDFFEKNIYPHFE
jgi:carotenoid cleavage dioxygenase-like enzyme